MSLSFVLVEVDRRFCWCAATLPSSMENTILCSVFLSNFLGGGGVEYEIETGDIRLMSSKQNVPTSEEV